MRKTLIIIITFNGDRWLPDVLDSIGSGSDFDVWVRDNGSFDETVSILKKHPAVTFFKQGENIGFGRANNEGIRFALEHDFDSVFLLNQDCRIQSSEFHKLRIFGLGNKSNVSCPVQLNWNGVGANHNFQARYAPKWASRQDAFDVDFVNAAAWFVPISLVRKVGGFNPVFFMYGEDRDWARRLDLIGGKFSVVPELFCYHYSSAQYKREPKIQTNKKIIFSKEVTIFFSAENLQEWARSFLGRAIKRSFHRKQIFNTLTLINPLAEFLIFRQIRRNASNWNNIRKQSTFSSPFLFNNPKR